MQELPEENRGLFQGYELSALVRLNRLRRFTMAYRGFPTGEAPTADSPLEKKNDVRKVRPHIHRLDF